MLNVFIVLPCDSLPYGQKFGRGFILADWWFESNPPIFLSPKFVTFVNGFDRSAHLSLFVDFELAILSRSTVDEHFVALYCASIAASIPKICSLKYKNMLGAIKRKWPVTLPIIYP